MSVLPGPRSARACSNSAAMRAVGIVGALIGGFIMSFFGAEGFTGFNLWSFVVALLGSVVLLAIINFVTKKSA